METLLKRIEEEEKVDIGKTAPYFRIRNTEGKDINRSDFKDKYLLIQFWASGIPSAGKRMQCSAVFIRKNKRTKTSH